MGDSTHQKSARPMANRSVGPRITNCIQCSGSIPNGWSKPFTMSPKYTQALRNATSVQRVSLIVDLGAGPTLLMAREYIQANA
jgi:hypothetical protein